MEIKDKLKGMFTALLAPYNKDGTINKDSLEKVVNFSLKFGITGFYVGGSTGEGVIMSTEERSQLFKLTAEVNKGRGVLIAHVGSTSTEEAVTFAKVAKSCGYDAVSAVAPFYYGHSLKAIKNYYKDIADSTNLPVVIYNFPLAGGFHLNKKIAMELLEDERIVAIKHTSQDLFMLEQFKTLKNPPIVFNGYDEMLAGGLIMGADGGIGSTYNFMPHKIMKVYNLFKEGNIKEAMEAQKDANKYIADMIDLGGDCGIMNIEKEILTQMGIDMGYCKKPFVEPTKEIKDKVAPIAQKLRKEIENLL